MPRGYPGSQKRRFGAKRKAIRGKIIAPGLSRQPKKRCGAKRKAIRGKIIALMLILQPKKALRAEEKKMREAMFCENQGSQD